MKAKDEKRTESGFVHKDTDLNNSEVSWYESIVNHLDLCKNF